MFLTRLNRVQKESFLALATKMALADGRVAVQEVALLDTLADAYGYDMNVPAEEIYGATNAAPFDTRSSKVTALAGMYMIAFVDEHLHIDESTVVQETIEAFGFTHEDAERIRSWAKEEARLFNELNRFIEEF